MNNNKANTVILRKILIALRNNEPMTKTSICNTVYSKPKRIIDGICFLKSLGLIKKIKSKSKLLITYTIADEYKNTLKF